MDYFSLYEIPVSVNIDKASLKKKYLLLSKKYHPDFFTDTEGINAEENLKLSAIVNEAYKTLQNEQVTLGYILTQRGLISTNEKYQLPADFLMEVMELNENWNEANKSNVRELEAAIYQPIATLIQTPDFDTLTKEDWTKLKEYYYKKKYLERLQQRSLGGEVEL